MTVNPLGVVSNTNNQGTYDSVSFTPTAGRLVVALVNITLTNIDGTFGVLSGGSGISSFALAGRAFNSANGHSSYIWVAEQFVGTPAATVLRANVSADPGTGFYFAVVEVDSMFRTGADAIRQVAEINDGPGASAPVFDFGVGNNVLTGNPTLGVLGNISSGGLSVPVGWTEPVGYDLTFGSPTYGSHIIYRDSGFTGTTVTYPSNETAHQGVMIELDRSDPGAGAPEFAGWGIPI